MTLFTSIFLFLPILAVLTRTILLVFLHSHVILLNLAVRIDEEWAFILSCDTASLLYWDVIPLFQNEEKPHIARRKLGFLQDVSIVRNRKPRLVLLLTKITIL